MNKNENKAVVEKWLKLTYGNNPSFILELKDIESIIKGLIQGLQIELGVTASGNWNKETIKAFENLFPNGLSKERIKVKNIIYILQAGLYVVRNISEGEINGDFGDDLTTAIKILQKQTGVSETGIVTAQLLKAILSLNSYELDKDGDREIREIQQNLNRKYHEQIGLIPTNGIYGTETNIALRKVIEMELGAMENNI